MASLGTASFTYDSSTDFGTGQSGLYSSKTNVLFDDFKMGKGVRKIYAAL